MTKPNDPSDLILLLLQGKLDAAQEVGLREQIRKSPELQAELDFWRGIHSIRAELPRYDFAEHLHPEILDSIARGRLARYSPEFSEASVHLQTCSTCRQDLELLRHAVKAVPEDSRLRRRATEPGLFGRLLSLFFSPRPVLASLGPLALVAVVAVAAFGPWGEQNREYSLALRPGWESRSVAADNRSPQYEFQLHAGIERISFQFVADRIDLPVYNYVAELKTADGSVISLDQEDMSCSQTEMRNHCIITVSQPTVMDLLKQGGIFTLTISESFPPGTDLEAASYEYRFRVFSTD